MSNFLYKNEIENNDIFENENMLSIQLSISIDTFQVFEAEDFKKKLKYNRVVKFN